MEEGRGVSRASEVIRAGKGRPGEGLHMMKASNLRRLRDRKPQYDTSSVKGGWQGQRPVRVLSTCSY